MQWIKRLLLPQNAYVKILACRMWGPLEVIRSRVEPSQMGLVSLQETPESSLAPSAPWKHSEKMAVYEIGSRLSPDTESAVSLILAFSASRPVRNKCLLFKLCTLWYICYSGPNSLRAKSNPTFNPLQFL